MIFTPDVAHRQRTSFAAYRQTRAFRDRHEPAKERPFAHIVLRRIVRRHFREHRVHARAVVALRIIFEDQLPIRLDVIFNPFR